MSQHKQHPRVFISYTHDSPEHSEWVLKLASNLRENGVDAFLDVWDLWPGANFTHWIESAISSADYCLIVCTPRYKEYAGRRQTAGVGYEQSIITDALLAGTEGSPKFIPILRAGEAFDAVPEWLQGYVYLDLRDDRTYERSLVQLVHYLYIPSNKIAPTRDRTSLDTSGGARMPIELTIEGTLDDLDAETIQRLLETLEVFLGDGITVTEVKRG